MNKIVEQRLRKYISNQINEVKKKKLNESDTIEFDELSDEGKQLSKQLEPILKGRAIAFEKGGLGEIITIETKSFQHQYRFTPDILKQLVKLDIRWIESDGRNVMVGI